MTTPTLPRRCHWLRRNANERRPDLLLFVDTESWQQDLGQDATAHTFRLGWASLARYYPYKGTKVLGWYEIRDPVEFARLCIDVAQETDCLYVVSHNMAFDARLLCLFTSLPGMGFPPDYAILSNSCVFFRFATDEHQVCLLDNMNYWHCSLEQLGKDFDLPKLDVDLQTDDDSALSRYCKRDVEILVKVWDYWLKFLDNHHLGNFSITTAGQAFAAFRHRFLSDKIGIHNNSRAIELERASYRGGRTETLRVGHFTGETYYKLDVNGLYAYCMREYNCPRALVKVIYQPTPDYLSKLIDTYQVIADVVVETDEPVYGIHVKGNLVFPLGTFHVTLTTWELIYALTHGHIRAIGACALYEHTRLFARYIDHFSTLRNQAKLDGNSALSAVCKLFMNGLQGKFGQRGYKQEIIGEAPLDVVKVRHWLDLESDAECWDWTFGGQTIRQTKQGEADDSFPAIASHIAAAGRMVLWDLIKQAGTENVFYCDTDSLIVNAYGYVNLAEHLDPLELGYLKVEGETTDLEIVAKKAYRFGDQRTMKGISRKATETSPNEFRQTHFTSLEWCFKHGDLEDVYTYDVTRHVKRTVHIGEIAADGKLIPSHWEFKAEQALELFEPRDQFTWDFWLDPQWFSSLASGAHPDRLPWWFLHALGEPEASELQF